MLYFPEMQIRNCGALSGSDCTSLTSEDSLAIPYQTHYHGNEEQSLHQLGGPMCRWNTQPEAQWATSLHTAGQQVNETWQERELPYLNHPHIEERIPFATPRTPGMACEAIFPDSCSGGNPTKVPIFESRDSSESYFDSFDARDLQWNDLAEPPFLPPVTTPPREWALPSCEFPTLPTKFLFSFKHGSDSLRREKDSLGLEARKRPMKVISKASKRPSYRNHSTNFEHLRLRHDFVRVVSGGGDFEIPAWSRAGPMPLRKQHCLSIRSNDFWEPIDA